MKVLDCESFDTTLISLEKITSIERGSIFEFLYDFDLEDFYRRNPLYETGDKILLSKFRKCFDPGLAYDQSNWFHLTRIYETEDFDNGILPLFDVVENKWDKLYNLVSELIPENEWIKFRINMEKGLIGPHSSLYKFRTSNNMFEGPYAISIRDTAFKCDEIRHHNYLNVPEIIKDICYCFELNYDYDLLDIYTQKSSPCIVKFRSDFSDTDLLGQVLLYMHHTIHNKRFNSHCKTNYNAHGCRIPPEDIIKVEYLDNPY
jgi:hypothetical protein